MKNIRDDITAESKVAKLFGLVENSSNLLSQSLNCDY